MTSSVFRALDLSSFKPEPSVDVTSVCTELSGNMCFLILLRNEDHFLLPNVLSCPKLRNGDDRYVLGKPDLKRSNMLLLASFYLND